MGLSFPLGCLSNFGIHKPISLQTYGLCDNIPFKALFLVDSIFLRSPVDTVSEVKQIMSSSDDRGGLHS